MMIRFIDINYSEKKEKKLNLPIVSFAKNNTIEWSIKFNINFHLIFLTFYVDCLCRGNKNEERNKCWLVKRNEIKF